MTVPAYSQHDVDDNRATESRRLPPATMRSGINDRRNPGSQKGPYSAAVEIADYLLPTTSHVYWTSFWLRKTTLLTLVALFLGLMISLVAVWFTNKSQNGYRPVISNNHYAWTYGPTAVLVVVLSFWRQVDYYCKISQPWQALRSGPVNADQSMLLDYLSPLQVTSFIHATKNRHIAVAASIAGFAILKAVIVLSTGLFTLAPVSITETSAVTIATAFDSARIWTTIPGGDYEVPRFSELYVINSLFGASIYEKISTSPRICVSENP